MIVARELEGVTGGLTRLRSIWSAVPCSWGIADLYHFHKVSTSCYSSERYCFKGQLGPTSKL